jgi:hypothetical protein
MSTEPTVPHWADDEYWTGAMDTYSQLLDQGGATLSLDLRAIAEVAYRAMVQLTNSCWQCCPFGSEKEWTVAKEPQG